MKSKVDFFEFDNGAWKVMSNEKVIYKKIKDFFDINFAMKFTIDGKHIYFATHKALNSLKEAGKKAFNLLEIFDFIKADFKKKQINTFNFLELDLHCICLVNNIIITFPGIQDETARTQNENNL